MTSPVPSSATLIVRLSTFATVCASCTHALMVASASCTPLLSYSFSLRISFSPILLIYMRYFASVMCLTSCRCLLFRNDNTPYTSVVYNTFDENPSIQPLLSQKSNDSKLLEPSNRRLLVLPKIRNITLLVLSLRTLDSSCNSQLNRLNS